MEDLGHHSPSQHLDLHARLIRPYSRLAVLSTDPSRHPLEARSLTALRAVDQKTKLERRSDLLCSCTRNAKQRSACVSSPTHPTRPQRSTVSK